MLENTNENILVKDLDDLIDSFKKIEGMPSPWNTFKYNTKREALTALRKRGHELKFCSPELKNDEKVVMVAIKENPWAFEYASEKLKDNKTFIMKALIEGVNPQNLIHLSSFKIRSDLELMTLAVEKDQGGWVFSMAQGLAAVDKELAAKALISAHTHFKKNINRKKDDLWNRCTPSIKEFFPKLSWFKTAQLYIFQLEKERALNVVSGGCADIDGIVW